MVALLCLSRLESRVPAEGQLKALKTVWWYWQKAEVSCANGSRMLKDMRRSVRTPPHGWIEVHESRVVGGGGRLRLRREVGLFYRTRKEWLVGGRRRIGRAAVRGMLGLCERNFGCGGRPTSPGPCKLHVTQLEGAQETLRKL